jgi:predicted amidohydrolase YtcJ
MPEKIYIQIDNEKIEATGVLLEQILESQREATAIKNERDAQEQLRAAARQSALAKLAALGLTEEEIAAL